MSPITRSRVLGPQALNMFLENPRPQAGIFFLHAKFHYHI